MYYKPALMILLLATSACSGNTTPPGQCSLPAVPAAMMEKPVETCFLCSLGKLFGLSSTPAILPTDKPASLSPASIGSQK